MADQRRAGTIQVKVQGVIMDAKGVFTYNLGRAKRTAIVGADRVHGYSEEPQVGFIEGAITDRGSLDLAAVVTAKDVTVTLELANGKVISLGEGWYAHEGTVSTDQAEIPVRWEGTVEEIS